jgi:hypothetical protein
VTTIAPRSPRTHAAPSLAWALLLTLAGCGSGSPGTDGAPRSDSGVDAPGGGPEVADDVVASDSGGGRGGEGGANAGDAAVEQRLCRGLFAPCTTDSQCCAPNRCVVITGVPQCQQEGPSADAGSASDVQTSDANACGTLQNTSPAVQPTMIASVTRMFGGGPLVDGTYELYAAEETLSSAPATYQRTFRLSAQGTAFEWAIHDEGLPPDHHFMGGITAANAQLTMVDTCVGGTLIYPYDAQGNELTLYFLFGTTGGRVFHYRARPAP